MAIYQYRCAECGTFDVVRPIGTAEPGEPCGGCGGEAPRVFTAPAVARTSGTSGTSGKSGSLARALDAQEASAHEPRVVRRSAEARPPARSADPRYARLPRP